MKIIEAMKKIKDLQRKAEDIRQKIGVYHADLDFETPVYGSTEQQNSKIKEWLQAHSDLLKEILSLRVAIQKTNILTNVTIDLGGKKVVKTIAEWIHRRRDLATLECDAWKRLNDKGLKEGRVQSTSGEAKDVKIRRYYNPSERDEKVFLYTSEPNTIDATLEVINAVTDLIME